MGSDRSNDTTTRPSATDDAAAPDDTADAPPASRDKPSGANGGARFSPADALFAMNKSAAALPIVGKHLKPLSSVTAMALWGCRVAPEMLSYLVRKKLPTGEPRPRSADLPPAHEVSAAALEGLVAPERLDIDWPGPDRLPPVVKHARKRQRYLHRSSVSYGPDKGQVLEIWRREDLPAQPAPVLIYVPGGGWVIGKRMLQGHALLSHMAERGWVCLTMDYRVSPGHRWPRHVADVKAAVAWARANIAEFGGNPDFVAAAGASAGGHLAALAGLTSDDPDFHIDLAPDADTTVDAVVGIYGRYDWVDRSTPERDRFVEFLERVVVKKQMERHPHVFHNASPIARVRPDAPPFLIVHGSADTVIPVAQAREFADRLRETSRSTVGYLEVPGAQHGFDLTDRARTESVVRAIGLFLDEIHENTRTASTGSLGKTAEGT